MLWRIVVAWREGYAIPLLAMLSCSWSLSQSFPLNFLLFSQTKIVSRAKVNIVSTDIYIIHLC